MKKLLIAKIAALVLFVSACNSVPEAPFMLDNIDSLATIYIENAEILYSDSAKIQMKLNAKLLENYAQLDTPYIEMCKGVKVLFYDVNQEVQSSLTADYAKYIEAIDLWEYKGNVLVVNTSNDELTTNHLFADIANDELRSDSLVTISPANGQSTTGRKGFKSDFNFKRYTFREVVSGPATKSSDWDF